MQVVWNFYHGVRSLLNSYSACLKKKILAWFDLGKLAILIENKNVKVLFGTLNV